jgi:hypothetical protein
MDAPGNTPLADQKAEARRLVEGARQQGVTLRLIGGLAIRQHCTILPFCERDYSDIDVVGLKAERHQIQDAFVELGYQPNERFNALHGDTRLEFIDPVNDRHVDVFLDTFGMDHYIDLRHRLAIDDYTIPLSDLLLSKLQIVRLNEKDVRDILTLLKDCDVGHQDAPGVINVDYIIDLCSCDWGLWKTLTTNVDKVLERMGDYALTAEEQARIRERLATLKEMLVEAPKCLRWKLRDVVGERLQWYNVPEE